MRLLHVIPTLHPAAGGPPVVATRLASAQAALGHEVSIVSYAPPADRTTIEHALQTVPHIGKVRRVELPGRGLLERLTARAARALLARLTGDVDFVHLHTVWEPIVRAGALAARAAGVPYCLAPHGMLDPWSMRQKRLKKALALALGYRAILDRAAFLHLLNFDEAQLLRPLGLRAPPQVIPNGVFLEEIEPLPPPELFLSQHPRLCGVPYILFLSRLHYKKGLDFLADAFAAVARQQPDTHLVVAGPDEGARQDFAGRIAQAGLTEFTHLVGPLYGPAKYAALVGAACFCLPSRQEGFSMAITEALACGIPAVISDACHFPEVAEAGAGHVVPLEPARIADALLSILRDPAARQRMGAAGRALVISRFTWPAIAQRTIDAYQRASLARAPEGARQT
jgi:glycosyltransferase involved in cell wall biosynthesis